LALALALALAAQPLACPASAEDRPDPAALFAASLWDTGGKAYALSRLRGRPLVVNFWARWCGPCRVEIPQLAQAQRRLGDKGLIVVGIGLEDQADTVREFARAYDMDYLVLLAKEHGLPLMRALGNGNGGLPFTLVIDASGQVVARKLGLISEPELDAALAVLFR
jgi:thiol-disulfide isomerase/thioredoxin